MDSAFNISATEKYKVLGIDILERLLEVDLLLSS